jgi:hypothetical protein
MARRHARTHKRTARKHSRAARKHTRAARKHTRAARKHTRGGKKHRRPFQKKGGWGKAIVIDNQGGESAWIAAQLRQQMLSADLSAGKFLIV